MSSKRIIVFDYIRGYLMLVILLNHLKLYPSFWQYFTGRGDMWISAAEGFFFVSGIMVGLIRGGEYKKTGNFKLIAKKILSRAFKIYLVFLGSTLAALLLMGIMNLIGINYAPATASVVKIKNINDTLWSFMTLYNIYGWTDFLKFYVIFLLFSVPLLWLLKIRMWYLVVGLAITFWFIPRLATFSFDTSYLYWGTYFVLGLASGFHYENIKKLYYSMPKKFVVLIPAFSIGLLVLLVSANWFTNFYRPPKDSSFINIVKTFTLYNWRSTEFTQIYLHNNRSGILRLPVFLIYANGLFFVFKYLEGFIKDKLDWLFGEVGRNSLRIYVVGAIFTYIFRLWIRDTAFIYNTVISGLYILLILKTSQSKWIKKIVPN